MRWRTLRLCFLLNCVYFSPFPVLFYVFFCPFISFFYPFPSFYLFPALLLSFYILIHLLFVLFYPFSTVCCLVLALIIFYLSLLPLFLSPFSVCSLLSLFYLLLFRCSDLIFRCVYLSIVCFLNVQTLCDTF